MNWDRVRRDALIVAAAGAVICIIGLLTDSTQFFASYLFAYLVFVGLALGCLSVLMVQYTVSTQWGLVLRRPLEAGAATLQFMVVLFLPILVGLSSLYPWARPDIVAHDPLLQHKALYLNVPFFIVRAVIYFALWIGIVVALRRWSMQQEATDDPAFGQRLHKLSILGLLLFTLTSTLALIDWFMSLEPDWFSTIYAIMLVAGYILAAFSLMIALIAWLSSREVPMITVSPRTWNDLGNLLISILLTWAYLEFSQYLVIWSGNLDREIPWYLRRLEGGWEWVAILLAIFNFAVPFLFLLSRSFKRNSRSLGRLSALLVIMHIVHSFWLVGPEFHPARLTISWQDVAALAFIGGLWTATFVWLVKRRPLTPRQNTVGVSKSEAIAYGQ